MIFYEFRLIHSMGRTIGMSPAVVERADYFLKEMYRAAINVNDARKALEIRAFGHQSV